MRSILHIRKNLIPYFKYVSAVVSKGNEEEISEFNFYFVR